jgi:Txe/YoeB family toxin of Txe-Axe toxin-antitoxin module
LRISFTDNSWTKLSVLIQQSDSDANAAQRLEDIRRTPSTGLGKLEPLKSDICDFWSRRIPRMRMAEQLLAADVMPYFA